MTHSQGFILLENLIEIKLTVHATIPERIFAVPVRSGLPRVGGDYTQTYCRAQHARCSRTEKSVFRDCGIHCMFPYI